MDKKGTLLLQKATNQFSMIGHLATLLFEEEETPRHARLLRTRCDADGIWERNSDPAGKARAREKAGETEKLRESGIQSNRRFCVTK
jgi:hypothetical protein